MLRRSIIAVLSVLFLAAMTFGLIYLFLHIARAMLSLNQPLVLAILAAAATILASTITVVAGKLFERRQEIEAHFRQKKSDQYYELLTILRDLATQQNGSTAADPMVVKRLSDWQQNLILFAGPMTIRAFVSWWTNLRSGHPTLQTVMLMEQFYKSLRSDLGISNRGLREGDLIQLILRNGDFFLTMLKKNPNMSMFELAAFEKQIDQLHAPKPPQPTLDAKE